MVWHHAVAPGDVVVVDRNCHVSILHSIIMTGAVPVFLPPTRNHYGIIGPIPQAEFSPEAIKRKIAENPLLAGVDPEKVKPRILTLTQSTYDGVLYNTETIKQSLDGYIDTLHFDEAWLPHAAFHKFYGTYHAMGRKRARPKDQLVFATQSTHKLLAGLSQASQVLVQDSPGRKLDRHLFNEAYLMHTSTSPQYAIIASCDVAAAMMEVARRHRAGGGKHPRGAGLPPRHAQGRQGIRPRLVVQGLGAGQARRTTASAPAPTGCSRRATSGTASATWPRASTCSTRSRARSSRRGWTCRASSPRPASRRRSSPSSSPSTAWWSRRPGLYSFFIMFTIGITKGRWNTLLTALQQFKDDYDRNQPLWRILPEFIAKHPRYERMGLRDLCQSIHEMYARGDVARLTTEMYLSDLHPAMKPSDAYAHIAHRKTERVEIDALEGRITTALLTPYPPGIPLLIPGERFNKKIVDFLRFTREFNAASPASTPTCTAWWRKRARAAQRAATSSTA